LRILYPAAQILHKSSSNGWQVDHPYSSLLRYAKCLKGDKVKLQKMVQMSWTFVNDSLCTTLCLQVSRTSFKMVQMSWTFVNDSLCTTLCLQVRRFSFSTLKVGADELDLCQRFPLHHTLPAGQTLLIFYFKGRCR
jgi:uncharacterized membrane protein